MQPQGPMYRAHTDLFPSDIANGQRQEARRASFRLRAGQAFENEAISNQVLQGKALLALIDLWTHLNHERLLKIHQWYREHAESLSKDEKRAVIFFGTFSIETLNINVISDCALKRQIAGIWAEHVKLFDAFEEKEILSFIHRVMLMSEAPLVPKVLGDSNQDVQLRANAYFHFKRLYDIPEEDHAQLDKDALHYSAIIVQDVHTLCYRPIPERSAALQYMFEDIMETFNLSRRFHRKVFGEANIRPDIIY